MATLESGTVDWAQVKEDVQCPLCEYNLRGLTEPRCPECGYKFSWAELLDPATRRHPYLFEHHPQRNVRSFFRTLAGGLRPGRFWRSLRPTQPSRPGRLIVYWVLTMTPLLLLAAAFLAIDSLPWARRYSRRLTQIDILELLEECGRRAIDMVCDPARYIEQPIGHSMILVAAAGLWPWVSAVALMIFRTSMGQARIRPIHVLRCVLYSSDIVFWLATAAMALSVAACVIDAYTNPNVLYIDQPAIAVWATVAIFPVFAWRLAIAYRYYLKFDHPIATVLASQIIAALLICNCVVLNWLRRSIHICAHHKAAGHHRSHHGICLGNAFPQGDNLAMSTAAPAAIDWSEVREDVLCPLCDYNLRGLVEPRCPECGHAFGWADLLDPKRRVHPYLFEHHPERNVRSFVRTAVGELRPGWFWRRLIPAQPSRPGRLMLYWALSMASLVPLIVGLALLIMVGLHIYDRAERPGVARLARLPQYRTQAARDQFADRYYPLAPSARFFELALEQARRSNLVVGTAAIGCVMIAWPWATFVVLMIFRTSMRRARIRWIHVVRTVVYSADIMIWLALATLAYSWIAYAISLWRLGPVMIGAPPIVPLILVLFLPVFIWRLAVAYRNYLRFDHPFATVIASQIILALLLMVSLCAWVLITGFIGFGP